MKLSLLLDTRSGSVWFSTGKLPGVGRFLGFFFVWLYFSMGVVASAADWSPHPRLSIPIAVNFEQPLVSKYIPVPDSPIGKEGVSILAPTGKIEFVRVGLNLRELLGIVNESLPVVRTILWRQIARNSENLPSRSGSLRFAQINKDLVFENISASRTIQRYLKINRIPLQFRVIREIGFHKFNSQVRPFFAFHKFNLGEGSLGVLFGSLSSFPGLYRLPADDTESREGRKDQPPIGPFEGCVPLWRVGVGFGLICLALGLFVYGVRADRGRFCILAYLRFGIGSFIWLTGHTNCQDCGTCEYR